MARDPEHGRSHLSASPVSADEMIKSADRLMLQAKNEGKNTFRYKVFDSPQLPPCKTLRMLPPLRWKRFEKKSNHRARRGRG